MKIANQEIERRMQGYLKRMKNDSLIKKYQLKEKGLYKIVSGSHGDYGKKWILKIVEGRFIDALSYAVQQPDFLGEWCSWNLPENCNHGYLEKIKPVSLKLNKNLNNLTKLEVKK